MKPYAQQAAIFRLALKEELVEPDEVIAWADTQLAAMDAYDDDLANLALLPPTASRKLFHALTPLAEGADPLAVFYGIMDKVHDTLLAHPERGERLEYFLYEQHIDIRDKMPEDLHFFYEIDHEFELAESGIQGSIEDATRHFIEWLSKFKKNP